MGIHLLTYPHKMPESPIVLRNAVTKFKRFVNKRRNSRTDLTADLAPLSPQQSVPVPGGRGRTRTGVQQRSKTLTHDTPPKLEKRLSSFFDNYYSDHPLSRSQTERYFHDVIPEPRQRYYVKPE